MSKWDERQKPHQKSKDHDKNDQGHGPKEHGLGARKETRSPKAPTADQATAALVFPAYYYVPSTPPVRDQGNTPQCTAYSSAYDQAQQDRPENGVVDFDEDKFFGQIGGTSDGSYMTDALPQRRDFGYPTVAGGDRSKHRISAFYELGLTVEGIKAALAHGHGVLVTTVWFHSWFHPFSSGKLPEPDYEVGGHAVWLRGWNDNYGFRIRNSWGTDWGLQGDCFMPYAFLDRLWGAWRTADR